MMGRIARNLVFLLMVIVPIADASPYVESSLRGNVARSNKHLLSVTRIGNNIFAVNDDGMFKADALERTWRRVKLPGYVPLNGRFAEQDRDSRYLLYFAERRAVKTSADIDRYKYGLYSSVNSGKTWHLISELEDIKQVIQVSNGRIFLQSGGYYTGKNGSRVLTSVDDGISWGVVWKKGSAYGIFKDPHNPNLVCVRYGVIRTVIDQADSEEFKWLSYQNSSLRKRFFDVLPVPYLQRYAIGMNGRYPPILATLDNYFRFDFGTDVKIPRIDIFPRRRVLRFKRDQAKLTTVAITLQAESSTGTNIASNVEFYDQNRKMDLWGVSLISPSGKRIRKMANLTRTIASTRKSSVQIPLGIPPSNSSIETIEDKIAAEKKTRMLREKVKNDQRAQLIRRSKIRKAGRFKRKSLRRSKPYIREIDLNQLCNFNEIGMYKVQLTYNSGGLFESGTEKSRELLAVAGDIFTVIIE